MDIAIRTRNVDVPEDVRSAVVEKVGHLERFLDGMERAEVRFSEERNPRIAEKEVCEVTVVGHGHVVRARASAGDALVAVDRVLDKLEHRMEKLKGRLVGRSHPRHHHAPLDRATGGSGAVEDVDPEADGAARIVKVKQFAIKPMTPEEAALQMELLSHGFFFFTNAETGRAAVVYRRDDGHIGLIDST
ncbi:MAG: ribosome hibernation-promoting factor, HPF/YfiA family [Acidimicrobiales bacterium]